MAISGQQNINIGAENQQAGSDDLYTAFNKVQNNFSKLFAFSSPFNTFSAGLGVGVTSNITAGTVTIVNTGVTGVVAGTGITVSQATGLVTISASGNGNVGVTNVGISSSTLNVTDSPIVSSGVITVDLPLIPTGPNFAAGEYIAPSVTVDDYGRITQIANTVGVGTVTSIEVAADGNGLQISGSPITSTGTIYVKNTGVTRINAGQGIEISDTTGEITISAPNQGFGTVSRIDFFSNNLTITGSPVTTTGNITIDIPNDITISGNLIADLITANTTLSSLGNASITGNITAGNISASTISGNFAGNLNGVVGGVTPNAGSFTTITATANITGNLQASSYLRFSNTAGYYTDFKSQTNVSNSSFYVPNSTGTIQQVLGITATGSTQTLGWKTIPAQTLTVDPRTGANFQVSSTPVLRGYPIKLRSGGYLDINIS